MIIPVVAACIVKENPLRVLLHRKDEATDEEGIPRNPELLGRWEFPGGMMKYAETPEIALTREIFEETKLLINVGRLIYAQTNIYEDKVHYLVLFYECRTNNIYTPKGCHYSELTVAEIASMNCLPGTIEVIKKLVSKI